MKKVLVTGADGFIGSHLCEILLSQNYSVRALCLYNSFGTLGWLENIERLGDIEVILGDVRDPDCCVSISKGVDIIFHLAALIAIPYSYHAPQSYIDTNVNGTLNMCRAALQNETDLMVHTSTSEVYGSARYVPIDETHVLQPQSPYSASKISADMIAKSFCSSFDLPLIIARPFNTFGPRQSARAIIPSVITQIASGKRELEVGNLQPSRDFNYVLDTCSGFLELAKLTERRGEVFNIGSGVEVSIEKTIKLIAELMEADVKITEKKERMRPDNSEVDRLLADNSKIVSRTNFKTKHSFSDGLQKTIAWFSVSENLKLYKTDKYNI